MTFSVAVDSSVSLNDLVARSRATGAVIVRTPHVGNVTSHSMGLADLGLRLLLYDRTLGRRDTSCHPHLFIAGGESEQIADPTILTTHARVIRPSRHASTGARVTDVHLGPLRRAYPDQKLSTYTEYLGANVERVLPILLAATDAAPELWKRRVDGEGRVSLGRVHSTGDLQRDGILGVTSDDRGWLIPNELNVLLTCTVETRDADWAMMMAGRMPA